MNAMILAAGRGKRLMPLTKHVPKPLVRINGKPILAHHLERLHIAGIDDVIINVSYLGHLIVEEFGYRYKSLRIVYCESSKSSSPSCCIGILVKNLNGYCPFLTYSGICIHDNHYLTKFTDNDQNT